MPSKFETSFGARLRKFEDAVQYISNWTGYAPTRPEIQLPTLTALIQSIKATNEKETDTQLNYQKAVEARQAHFDKGPQSVEKLLAPIVSNVKFLYGRQSTQAHSVSSIIRSFRKSGLVKLPADPANPGVEKTVSQSQRSFGSRTQFFSDIIVTLSNSGTYSSSNPQIDLPALKQKLIDLTTANDNVATQLQLISTIRSNRQQVYEQMATHLHLIKDYTAAQYGKRSREYKSITALKVK